MQELLTTSVAYVAREAHVIALIGSVLLACALTYMLYRSVKTVKSVPIVVEHVQVPMTKEEHHLYLRLAISDILSEGFASAVKSGKLTRDEATMYAKRVFKALGVSEHIPSDFRVSPSAVRNPEEDKARLTQLRLQRKARKPNKLIELLTRRKAA